MPIRALRLSQKVISSLHARSFLPHHLRDAPVIFGECSILHVEPRHAPTRVDFFTTSAGVRVHSVAGGQTYSAVATVDGRVFKWGLYRAARRSRGNKHSRDGEGGEDQGNDPSEEDGEAAVEASVPRQVAGVGMEASGLVTCRKRH